MKNNGEGCGCFGKTGYGKLVNLALLPLLNGPLIAPQKPAGRIRRESIAITFVPDPEQLVNEEAAEHTLPSGQASGKEQTP